MRSSQPAHHVAPEGLLPVGERPPLHRYVAQVLARARFMWALANAQLRSTYGRDRLGALWLTLTPLLNALTYYLIFGVLLNTQNGIDNFIGFLIVGVFLYQFSASAITEGSRVIRNNQRLVQTLSFPRAVLPVSLVLRTVLALAPALLVMFVLVLAIPPHAPLTWRWLMVVPGLLLQVAFTLGVVLVLARLVAKVNDISNMLQFALRTWMYFSGIFYSFETFVAHPTVLTILELNPMHAFLTIARDALLYDRVADSGTWLVATGWSIPLLVIGLVVFWQAEEEYARA